VHEEVLPIAVDIIAASGCEAVIFELAVLLEKARHCEYSESGSTLYRRSVGMFE
jgi:hypothetical protein